MFTFVYLAGVLGERIQYDLRKMMFNHLQELSLSYYAQNAVGRLIARVTSDTGRVAELVTWGMVDITWAVLNITTSLIFMVIINWRLALIVSVIIPLMVLIAVQFRKKILVEFRNSRRANSKITGAYNENIQGVRVVKALGREDENLQGVPAADRRACTRPPIRAAWLSALFLPTVQIIAALALGAIVWYGGLQIQAGLDHHRRHQCLRLVSDLHDVAGAGPGARLRRNAAFHRLGGAHLQADRYAARCQRPAGRGARLHAPRRDRVRARGLLLRGQEAGPDRLHPEGQAGRDDRAGRADRRRQVDHREPAVPLLRAAAPARSASAAATTRDYTLQSIHSRIGIVLQTPHLFSGHGAGEHPLRPAGRQR